MKISLIIKDKKKGKIEIPISLKEISGVYDGIHICLDDKTYKVLKLNKVDKNFLAFRDKMDYLIHDIIHEGKVYELKDKKKLKFKLSKKRHYFVRKPIWKK